MGDLVFASETDAAEWKRVSRDLFEAYEHSMQIIRDLPSALRLQVKITLQLVAFYDLVSEELLCKTIPTLVSCLESKGEDADPAYKALIVAAVHGLTRIARLGDGRLAAEIAKTGAIGFMVEIIETNGNDAAFLQVLFKCLWVLVSFGGELCRKTLFLANGVEAVTCLLTTATASMRRYLLEILSALAMVKSARKLIVEEGGLGYLVEAIGIGSMASRGRACQAIGLIGASSQVLRKMLAETGTIPLLINLFNEGDNETKVVAANALGLALSNVGYIRAAAQAGAIPLYAQLLRGGVLLEMEIAVDAFCQLSVAEENAVSIAEYIVEILRNGTVDAKESACHVLWDIAAYEHSVHVIQNSGAVHIMLELLRGTGTATNPDDYTIELEERLCSLVAKMSSYKVHRHGLVEEGAIKLMTDILAEYSNNPGPYLCREYAAKAILNLFEDPDYRDMVCEELGEPFSREFEGAMNRLDLDTLLDSDAYYSYGVNEMSEEEYDDDEPILMDEA